MRIANLQSWLGAKSALENVAKHSVKVLSVLALAVLTSGCVMHVDDSSEFGRGNFLAPYVGVETHPYVQGEDWSGWAKVRYKITHTTCPEENRGDWIDGAFGWSRQAPYLTAEPFGHSERAPSSKDSDHDGGGGGGGGVRCAESDDVETL